VHLTDWPSASEFPADHSLVAAMDAVRDVSSAALSVRKARGLRVRLPLPSLTVATPRAEALRPFADLVADEVNVKSVVFTDEVSAYCENVLTVVPRALGPRVGGAVQHVIRAVRAGDWSLVDGAPVAAGVTLQEGEYELRLVAADTGDTARASALMGVEGVVVLDTTVTPELAAEGLARDVVRVVQQARREANLDVSDRISLVVEAPPAVARAIERHRDFVAGEVLATSITFGPAGDGAFGGEAGDGKRVRVEVTRA
jgi:isoleucyl-tRNA synthetase